MKKIIGSVAAVAALAVAPGVASALPPSGWAGWSTAHYNNAASVAYWQAWAADPTGGGSGQKGNSGYCVDVSTADKACSANGVVVPLQFTGVLTAGGQSAGCNHYDGVTSDNPCSPPQQIGAFWVGTGPQGDGATQVTPAASPVGVYTEGATVGVGAKG